MVAGIREDAPGPDPGLYGPDSVTWQMHGDPMMWIAGVRALYLQALHPLAVRGVIQNSDFRQDAWGRLLRTARFVATITYGTTEAAERAGARVRGIHRRISVTDPGTGARHAVDEPDLLLWVHCAEVASYLHVVRRSGYPLTDGQADAYVAENREAPAWSGSTPPPYRAIRRNCARTSRRCAPNSPPPPRPARSTPFCAGPRCTPRSSRRAT